MQRWPERLLTPSITGMPGIGDEIDGAVQQAPHCGRQFTGSPSRALPLR